MDTQPFYNLDEAHITTLFDETVTAVKVVQESVVLYANDAIRQCGDILEEDISQETRLKTGIIHKGLSDFLENADIITPDDTILFESTAISQSRIWEQVVELSDTVFNKLSESLNSGAADAAKDIAGVFHIEFDRRKDMYREILNTYTTACEESKNRQNDAETRNFIYKTTGYEIISEDTNTSALMSPNDTAVLQNVNVSDIIYGKENIITEPLPLRSQNRENGYRAPLKPNVDGITCLVQSVSLPKNDMETTIVANSTMPPPSLEASSGISAIDWSKGTTNSWARLDDQLDGELHTQPPPDIPAVQQLLLQLANARDGKLTTVAGK